MSTLIVLEFVYISLYNMYTRGNGMGYKRKMLEARKRSRDRRKHLDKGVDYAAATRQCLKKNAYPSEKKVIEIINNIAEVGRRCLRYYQCPLCDLWHISSHKKYYQNFVS